MLFLFFFSRFLKFFFHVKIRRQFFLHIQDIHKRQFRSLPVFFFIYGLPILFRFIGRNFSVFQKSSHLPSISFFGESPLQRPVRKSLSTSKNLHPQHGQAEGMTRGQNFGFTYLICSPWIAIRHSFSLSLSPLVGT